MTDEENETLGISVPKTEQTKKRSVEDNTQQVGGSVASKRQKKDEPLVDDKDNYADPPRDFRLLKGIEMAELFGRMVQTHRFVKNTILLYDRDLKAAQKSVNDLSKKNEALQAENVQFETELIESKDNVVALEAEKARLIEECILKEREKVRTEMATELGQVLLDSMRSRRLQYNGESDKSSHPE